MDGDVLLVAFVAFTFLFGGMVKGVIGVGLPTFAMGLLSLAMTPARAAALLLVPTLVTNIWQAAAGSHTSVLLRRLWPMLLGICIGTWASGGLLTADDNGRTITLLGCVLVLYALFGIAAYRLSVQPRTEPWLSPIIGLMTGGATTATGVFMIPAVPYLQALSLDKDDLVQAIGISVLVSSLALAVMLVRDAALPTAVAGASLAAIVPALLGMAAGQLLRSWIRAETFRTWFFVGLLLLGAHLALRSFL